MTNVDHLFNGFEIPLVFPANHPTTFQAEAIRKEVSETPANKLRFTCLVAETLNEALNGGKLGSPTDEYGEFDIDGKTYRLNPKCRSQFGVDAKLRPYLTTSLIQVDTNIRYKFRWVGDNVPRQLKELAVAHDEGGATRKTRVRLSLDQAEKTIIGVSNDPRKRHDNGPKSKRKLQGDTRRTHRRICREDLVSA